MDLTSIGPALVLTLLDGLATAISSAIAFDLLLPIRLRGCGPAVPLPARWWKATGVASSRPLLPFRIG